jgi:hypothetical protein
MLQQHSEYDPFRPVAPQMKWLIVGAAALLLGAWELTFHLWFMGLPMVAAHRFNALVAGLLVAGVVLASFTLIQQYEQQTAATVETLRQKNEALRTLETERDERLLNLAGDLALALVDVTNKCEIALTYPNSNDPMETLAAVKARIHELYGVERSLVDLEREGSAVAAGLPSILEGYERSRGPSAPHAPADNNPITEILRQILGQSAAQVDAYPAHAESKPGPENTAAGDSGASKPAVP